MVTMLETALDNPDVRAASFLSSLDWVSESIKSVLLYLPYSNIHTPESDNSYSTGYQQYRTWKHA